LFIFNKFNVSNIYFTKEGFTIITAYIYHEVKKAWGIRPQAFTYYALFFANRSPNYVPEVHCKRDLKVFFMFHRWANLS